MKKNGLFAGWREVFSFTASQNMKSGGYKVSTLLVGIIIAVAFSLISILMAVFQKDDSSEAFVEVDEGFGADISEVFLIDNEILDDETIRNLLTSSLALEGVAEEKIPVKLIDEKEKDTCIKDNNGAIVVQVTKENEKNIILNAYTNEGSTLNDGTVDEYMDYVLTYIDVYGYEMAGVPADKLPYFMAPYYTQSLSVNDSAESMGVMLTELLVPMLFSLVVYAMLLMHGQSVTKAVVAEKSSKLMEMLLTSVKPYALITGKILAVSAMAIFQLFFWIVCGFGGYIIGDTIADKINPQYTNYVNIIIDIMAVDNGAGAFSAEAVILAILVLVTGFFMYCVVAGLVAATVSKMEDISTAMSLFQLPVVIGWIVAYLVSFIDNDGLLKLVHLVPVTSPFILPADVILGKCTLVEGIISLAILLATTTGLILITGKVYKGKIFNRR